jgi:hypothetical protein
VREEDREREREKKVSVPRKFKTLFKVNAKFIENGRSK